MGLLKIQEPKIVSLGQGAAAEIAHRLEVSRASVYRVIEDARAKTEGVYRVLEAHSSAAAGNARTRQHFDDIRLSARTPRQLKRAAPRSGSVSSMKMRKGRTA